MIKISDCCITRDPISQLIADKILYHVQILNTIGEEIETEVFVSKKSGYRSYEYELSRGRHGTSQHCFRGKGAMDLTCNPKHIDDFVAALRKSPYNRVCYYTNNQFIHVDFKYAGKHFFICGDGKNWIRQT